MTEHATPLRIFPIDIGEAIRLAPGDRTPMRGHEDHRVAVKTLDAVLALWLTVRCSCGETFSGAIDRRSP